MRGMSSCLLRVPLALCLLLLLESVALASARYFILIDAGSTGSKLRVYRRSEQQLEEVSTKNDEVKPGLSAYGSNLTLAGPSLVPLLEEVKRHVPEEERADAPLWVKATAGVRVLDAEVISAVLKAVQAYLSQPENCHFKFQSAKLLSGDEEAAFAFISVNDALGNPKKKVGVLDLGGASTQVAFQPVGPIGVNSFVLYMGGQRSSIYAKSFTKFGLNSAFERAEEALVAAAPAGSKTVDFPCLLEGFSLQGEDVDGKPVDFTGTSDGAACAKLVGDLMHTDYECLLPPCSMMGTYMPAAVGRFYATAGFFYTANVLGLVGWMETKVLTPAEILAATRHLCGLNEEKAKKAFPDSQWKYLQRGCFTGYYVYTVLKDYGFADDDRTVIYTREIHGNDIGWARGAVLFETEEMPKVLPRLRPNSGRLLVWQVICGILAAVTIGLAASMVCLARGRGGGAAMPYSAVS